MTTTVPQAIDTALTDTDAALGRLADEAGLTVHVRLMEGEDTGHALAAIFKALGVALARASATTR